MKIVTARIKGVAPYSQSKHYMKDKMQGESDDDHYRRTWRKHMHVDNDGVVFIPPNGLKNMMSEAAKFMDISVPGRGKNKYTKNFEAGVLVAKPALLGIKAADVQCEELFLPSDGRRGGSKRVMKYYPVIHEWNAEIEFVIVDETVLQTSITSPTRSVFEVVLEGAGQFIGVGRFRPRNNGYYGRFDVLSVK